MFRNTPNTKCHSESKALSAGSRRSQNFPTLTEAARLLQAKRSYCWKNIEKLYQTTVFLCNSFLVYLETLRDTNTFFLVNTENSTALHKNK